MTPILRAALLLGTMVSLTLVATYGYMMPSHSDNPSVAQRENTTSGGDETAPGQGSSSATDPQFSVSCKTYYQSIEADGMYIIPTSREFVQAYVEKTNQPGNTISHAPSITNITHDLVMFAIKKTIIDTLGHYGVSDSGVDSTALQVHYMSCGEFSQKVLPRIVAGQYGDISNCDVKPFANKIDGCNVMLTSIGNEDVASKNADYFTLSDRYFL